MRKIRIYLFLLMSLGITGEVFAQTLDDQTDLVLWDGMENKSTWKVADKGRISINTEYVTEGRSSLRINGGDSAPPSGVRVTKENTYLDLSFAKKIVFDVYNSGAPCQVAVALYAGQRYESIPKELTSGLNKNVTFELNAKDFKFILTAENIAQIVEFIIYPQDDKVEPLYIDNIRVKKLGGLQSFPPGISPAVGALIAEGFTPVEAAPIDTGGYTVAAFPREETFVINEPKSLLLLGTGLIGFCFFRKRDLKK